MGSRGMMVLLSARRALGRWVCMALACLMAVMAPLCACAGTGGAGVDVDAWVARALGASPSDAGQATPSDAAWAAPGGGTPLPGGGAGLLGRATDGELERYYQSFVDYPVTLLEWPEGVPQPRFAAAALGAAAVYVLEILAIAVGIYCVGVALDYLWKIYENYETTLRLEGKGTLLATWQDVLSAQWGDAISGMGDLYKDFKAYCKGGVEGYASGDGSLTVAGSDALLVPGYDLGYSIYPSLPAFHIPDDILASVSSYPHAVIYASDGDWVYGAASSSPVVVRFTYNKLYGYLPAISCDSSCISFKGHTSNPAAHEINEVGSCSLSLPRDSGFSFYVTGKPVIMVDGNEAVWSDDEEAVIAPEKPWADLQWNYYDLAQSVSVPAGQAEADEILANAAAAQNAAEVAKAFEKTWEMGDAVADEGEDTYPWVPSITGWLEKLAQGIDAIKGWVSAIPDALAGIGEGIQALPQSIARAFEEVVIGEDDGSYAITGQVTGKFPFCVPFDLVGCFRVLQAPAAPPAWRVPFVVDNSFIHIHEEVVIDLSGWERPAAVVRFFVLLMFIFGLAYVTRYVVKG